MSEKKIPAPIIRQLLLVTVIASMVYLIGKEMMPYVGGVLGGVTLYVLTVGFQKKLEKRGWKPSIAAVLLTIASVIVILVPIAGIAVMFASRVRDAVKNSEEITETFKTQIGALEETVGYNLTEQVNSQEVGKWVSNTLQGMASSGLTVFIALGILLFVLYYMLVGRDKWQAALLTYLPLKEENAKTIGDESQLLVKSNAIGIPMVALLQGVVALIGYYIFGVENPFFWFVITTIGSMIPFIGTALGIIPVFLLLLSQGETGNAIGLLIYGTAVVGATDNLFRLVIQRKLADIHPMVTLVGVVVGVPLFGFLGLIFGPLLVSLFLLVLKIYKNEYGDHGEKI